MQNLAELELRCENLVRAHTLAEQCLALNRKASDEGSATYQLHTLGVIAWQQGDTSSTARWMIESLTTRARIGDQHGLVRTFSALASMAMDRRDSETAALFALAGNRFLSASQPTATPNEVGDVQQAIQKLEPERVEGLADYVNAMSMQEIVDRAIAFLQAING